jgi:type 1 glutamine amidotransferase
MMSGLPDRPALWTLAALLIAWFAVGAHAHAADRPLRLLFLGDNGPHRPAERAALIAPVLEKRGIAIDYANDASALNAAKLSQYDGLVIYANIERITPEQEQALLDYVASGKGFVPLHCASYCFLNSDKYIDLVGAQFQRHGGEVFSTVIAQPQHPIMQGFGGFESWDETYIHRRHNEQDRTVLEYRLQGAQAEGRQQEPWSWVRTHGKGRVFYTAWGHDERTWRHPGFHNLLERGIRWACGQDPSAAGDYVEAGRFVTPQMTPKRTDVAPFEYLDVGAKIPNYPRSAQWGTQAEPLTKMQKPLCARRVAQALCHAGRF